MARITWKGREVRRKVAAAAAVGVSKTMADCVATAKREHPWDSQTGMEEGAVRMSGVSTDGAKVSGTWGAYTNYSLFLEIGTSRIGPTAEERAQEGQMWDIPGVRPGEGVPVNQAFTIVPLGNDEFITRHVPSTRMGNPGLMAPRPFLRPAADRHYRALPTHIAEAYRSGS